MRASELAGPAFVLLMLAFVATLSVGIGARVALFGLRLGAAGPEPPIMTLLQRIANFCAVAAPVCLALAGAIFILAS